MRNYISTNILIFLIVSSNFINCLVLYHRIPKPRLICREEAPDNSTQSGIYRNKSFNNPQMPIIPEEDGSGTIMHIEHVRLRRENEEGPFLQIDDKNRISLNNFEIVGKELNNTDKEEIRKKIIDMCQAFNVKNHP